MVDTRKQRFTAFLGYSLIELLVVLLLLAIVATIAMPLAEPTTAVRAEAAAKDVAQAYRFAQGEAQRTGSSFVVLCDVSSNSISINKLDMSATPPKPDLITPVLHPLDKRPYRISFSDGILSGVRLTNCAFKYSDGNTVSRVMFIDDGTPVNIVGKNKNKTDVLTMTSDGLISVTVGRVIRTVKVGIVTGRVTIVP